MKIIKVIAGYTNHNKDFIYLVVNGDSEIQELEIQQRLLQVFKEKRQEFFDEYFPVTGNIKASLVKAVRQVKEEGFDIDFHRPYNEVWEFELPFDVYYNYK